MAGVTRKTKAQKGKGLFSFWIMLCSCGGLLLSGCQSTAYSPLELAERAWVAGDCATSARHYEAYLQGKSESPALVKTYFNLADVYYLCPQKEQRDLTRAQDLYRRVVEQAGEARLAVTAWQRIAEIQSESHRRYEAIAEYENLLQQYPDTAERRPIRLAVANLYNDLNNYSQAETEYEKVVANAPYDHLSEAAYLRISNINNLRERYERAIAALEQIMAHTADGNVLQQARFTLSEIHLKQFNYAQAIEQLRAIKDPAPPEAEFIKKRIQQIEQERRRHAGSPGEFDWSK